MKSRNIVTGLLFGFALATACSLIAATSYSPTATQGLLPLKNTDLPAALNALASGADWDDGIVKTSHLKDANVTAAKFAAGAVGAAALGTGSVTQAKLAAPCVKAENLYDLNVTTGKLAADCITSAKIGGGAVYGSDILDANITASDLASGCVTSAKILDGGVYGSDILDGNITAADLATGSVTSAKILDDAIHGSDVFDGNLTAADFATGSVTSAKILDGTVSGGDLSVGQKLRDAYLSILSVANGTKKGRAFIVDGNITIVNAKYLFWTPPASTGGTVLGNLYWHDFSTGGDHYLNTALDANLEALTGGEIGEFDINASFANLGPNDVVYFSCASNNADMTGGDDGILEILYYSTD